MHCIVVRLHGLGSGGDGVHLFNFDEGELIEGLALKFPGWVGVAHGCLAHADVKMIGAWTGCVVLCAARSD